MLLQDQEQMSLDVILVAYSYMVLKPLSFFEKFRNLLAQESAGFSIDIFALD